MSIRVSYLIFYQMGSVDQCVTSGLSNLFDAVFLCFVFSFTNHTVGSLGCDHAVNLVDKPEH